MIYADEYTEIRKALKKDVRSIMRLIGNSVAAEELLRRTRAQVAADIGDYSVFEIDGNMVGCVAIHPLEGKTAEMGCLFVAPGHENSGIGKKLMLYAESRARELGMKKLLALSTQAFNYLQSKGGFTEGTAEVLPAGRDEVAIPTLSFDTQPNYVVVGGLVFQQLTGAYLQEWGDKWTERAPQRLVELFSFQQEKRPDPGKKVVFLSQVLPAAINLGYQQYSGLVLERVNGEEIRNLAELSKRVDEAQGEFLIFEFTDDPGKLVLDAAEAKAIKNPKLHMLIKKENI